ncbi:hypothetical protein D3C87_270000 [compost metagenome]
MVMKKLILAMLAFAACSLVGYSQQNDLDDSKRYIKVVIDADISLEQQTEITVALSQIPGVETSRMDNITGIFLGIYIPNDNLSEQIFLSWFSNHGFPVKCYFDAAYTPNGMINLSKTTCP